MEINWSNFDDDSKKIIKELAKEDKKFNNLITKLQTVMIKIDDKAKLTNTPYEGIKK
jgi:hypothetical protein